MPLSWNTTAVPLLSRKIRAHDLDDDFDFFSGHDGPRFFSHARITASNSSLPVGKIVGSRGDPASSSNSMVRA
jgi:hypothetical protein